MMSHPGATALTGTKVVIIGSGFGGLTAAKASSAPTSTSR